MHLCSWGAGHLLPAAGPGASGKEALGVLVETPARGSGGAGASQQVPGKWVEAASEAQAGPSQPRGRWGPAPGAVTRGAVAAACPELCAGAREAPVQLGGGNKVLYVEDGDWSEPPIKAV